MGFRQVAQPPDPAPLRAARVRVPEGLDAFPSEEERESEQESSSAPTGHIGATGIAAATSILKWVAVLVLGAAIPITVYLLRGNPGSGVTAAAGSLTVTTTEPGADVLIAGDVLGRTPLTVKLAPGSYAVELRTPEARRVLFVDLPAGTIVTHHVDLAAGAPSAAAAGTPPGNQAPVSPATERPTTNSAADTRQASTGTQAAPPDLPAAATAAPRRAEQRVADGIRRSPPRPLAATGLVSINALPWADVWIDGEKIGQTPIGNVSRPVGRHEVVLRHPELGERTETVTITADRPARLGIDMRRK